MTYRHHLRPLPTLLLAAALTCWISWPLAQDTPDPASPAASQALDPDRVQQRLEAIAENADLSEAERTELTTQLKTVLENLEQAKRISARAEEFAAALDSAPREAAALRDQLAVAASEDDTAPAVDLPDDADLDTVLARIAAEQADIASTESRIDTLDATIEEIDQQPNRLRDRAAALDAELAAPTPAAEPAGTATAADAELPDWLRVSRQLLLRAESYMIDQQLLSGAARRDLASAQRDQAEQQLARAKARRQILQARADELRQAQADAVRIEAEADRQAVAGADTLIRDVADANAAIAVGVADTTTLLNRLDEQRIDLERQIARIDQDFTNARKRLEAAGLNRALGQILIDQRNQLPNPRRLRREADARADQIAESTLASIRWREELRRLDDLDVWATDRLDGRELTQEQRAELVDGLRTQAKSRRDLLRTAIDVQESYRRALEQVDFTARQLAELAQRYDRYLSERLLWVRSIVPLAQQSFAALPAAVWWVVSPLNWSQVGETLLHEATRSPQLWLGLLVVTVLLWRSASIKRAIRATAEPLRRISTDGFRYTLKGLGLTLLASSPWPLLLLTIGMVLGNSLHGGEFTKAVGDAMLALAAPLYYLLAFRMLCLRGGVADRHFRWQTDTLVLLRNSAYTAVAVLLPVGLVAAMVHSHEDPEHTGTLGRLSLAAFELGFAAFTALVLHPTRGAIKHILAEHPDGWLSRLRLFWYPAAVAGPLALAGLALSGYLYTSGILVESLINELWLALALIVAHQLIARWLLVTRRRLALQAALERRAQREAAKAADSPGMDVLAVQEEAVDLASLDAQTRQLLNLSIFIAAVVGLWLVWSSVLPALNFLESFTLWSYTSTVDGVKASVPVTLADLGLVLVILAAAIAAARNLPALLEILLLQNSHISAGSRYTIITLTGYAITAIGALMVFGALGLSWGQVQWLVAALGVGIGFGLQEIVANFISGLIILFERPVRVGDIVSIGDTDGVVTKIEIRATTVRNWDRKELLVPNKELITGRVINWTLTDSINRIVIVVGAEYGCDTRKALQLLGDAAREHEEVLDDPAPIISFEGFGNDSLTLVLRCYLPNLDNRINVITQLHQAVDDKFRAAGIGIAFPQRDVHLRASEPLEVRVSSVASSAAQPAATSPGAGPPASVQHDGPEAAPKAS